MRREILRSLEEKVDPGHSALMVVDMQNDFCDPEGCMHGVLSVDLAMVHEMVPRLRLLLEGARAAGVKVLFVRNTYNDDSDNYLSDVWLEQHMRKRGALGSKVPFCRAGSWGWEFYRDIAPIRGEAVVTKHRYSAFAGTDLDLILRSQGVRTIILTGVATNVCVESTAREGFMRDYYVVQVGDCTAAYSKRLHEATLENIGTFFGSVTTADGLLLIWAKAIEDGKQKIRVAV